MALHYIALLDGWHGDSSRMYPVGEINRRAERLLEVTYNALMRGIAADTPLRLRYWPNLTRLPPIPEAMRITAFLTRTPVNLKLITRLLKVPPEDLFNYLAAAYGIGILDLPSRSPQLSVISTEPVRPGSKVETVAAPSRPQSSSPAPAPSPAKPAQGSGRLLSRLLKKVIGL